jgi:hypothetical protein
MYQANVNISKSAYSKLSNLSMKLGKKESEIANLAILNYNPLEENQRLNLIKKARGIWSDRNDLPSPKELRDLWERKSDG